MIPFAKFGVASIALAAAGCGPGPIFFHDEPIDGPYRLRAPAAAAELHICYERRPGQCDLRIPGRVFAIAYDGNFVAAAVHPLNLEEKKMFYYIVRDFDGPRADLQRAVRGPYEQDAFINQMQEHGVPAPRLVVPPR